MRISNPTFRTEDFEITYIGCLISEELIGSLLEEFVKIYSIDELVQLTNSYTSSVKNMTSQFIRSISSSNRTVKAV